MATKEDLELLKQHCEQSRQQLVAYWEKSLDQDGNFEHTFGNASLTPCTSSWSLLQDNLLF